MKEHQPDPDEPVVPVSMLRIDSANSSPLSQTSPCLTGAAICSPPTSMNHASTFSDANCIQQHQQHNSSGGRDNAQKMGESAEGDNILPCSPPPSASTAAAVSSPAHKVCPRTLKNQATLCSTDPASNATPINNYVTSLASTSTSTCTSTGTASPLLESASTVSTTPNKEEPMMQHQEFSSHGVDEVELSWRELVCTEGTVEHDDSNGTSMEGIEYIPSPSPMPTFMESEAHKAIQSDDEGGAIDINSSGQSAAAEESLPTPTHSSGPSKVSDNHNPQAAKSAVLDESVGTANLKAASASTTEACQGEREGEEANDEREPITVHPTFAQPTVTASSSSRHDGQESNTATPPPSSSSSSSSSSTSSSYSSEPSIPLHGVIAFNEAVYTAVHYSSELYIIPRASRGFCWNEDLFLKPYQRRSLGLTDHLHQQHLQQRHHQQQSFRYGSPFQSSNNLHSSSSGGGGGGGGGRDGDVLQDSSPLFSSSSNVTATPSSHHQDINEGGSSSPSLLGQDSLVTVHEIWLDDHETAGILPERLSSLWNPLSLQRFFFSGSGFAK